MTTQTWKFGEANKTPFADPAVITMIPVIPVSDTNDTIVVLSEIHNDVMMMYSKDKIHI